MKKKHPKLYTPRPVEIAEDIKNHVEYGQFAFGDDFLPHVLPAKTASRIKTQAFRKLVKEGYFVKRFRLNNSKSSNDELVAVYKPNQTTQLEVLTQLRKHTDELNNLEIIEKLSDLPPN